MSSLASVAFKKSVRKMTPVTAPEDQREELNALKDMLSDATPDQRAHDAYRLVGPSGENIELPESVFFLLAHITQVLASGDAITVVPVGKELTTQQAADILNVSRQYLVRLLDEDRIPYRKTGTHRRVRMEDLMAFKDQRDRERAASLDDLSRLSQEFGGYEELSEDG